MNNITVADALEFAEHNFPKAPEKLAELLQVKVRRSAMNCDGYCLPSDQLSIIRINNTVSAARQRFTLAHELGHLILGVPTVVGETMLDSQSSKNAEEKQVNALAGKLLLPLAIAKQLVTEVPVTASVIKAIAKRANVSELFVARRMASLAAELGLKDGLVVFYEDNTYRWHWSETVGIGPEVAQELLGACLQANPNPARIPRPQHDDVIVASLLKNPYRDTTTVFVQVVAEEYGLKETAEETKQRLENSIFANSRRLKPSLEGCFSTMKAKAKDLSLDQAVSMFNSRYLGGSRRWDHEFQTRLKSHEGQQYIRLRLKAWVRP